MDKKQKVGRPAVKDKRIPVTFMALESKVRASSKKAKEQGSSIKKELESMLYDFLTR